MKLFRFFLDGVQLQDDPIGWDEARWVIFRQKELNALLVRIDLNLEFHGDGYAALSAAYDTQGHCGTVDIEIQELTTASVYRRIHTGIIRLSALIRDRKEFTIKTPIEDNSFYAKINYNKNIAAFPFAERSKNDLAITACPTTAVIYTKLCDCSDYSVQLAALLALNSGFKFPFSGAHYKVFDLFEYLVTFMSDGAMDFQSTVFDTGGDYEGLMVTCGLVLKTYLTGTTEAAFKDNFPKISFETLFKECNKKIHLGMTIDNSGSRPKLIIERDSYFNQTTVMHTCNDIDRVVETTDVGKLYSKLVLGSTKTRAVSVQCPPNGLNFPERVSLLGFKEEEFIIIGDCNLDNELNLRGDFIVSSNIIEDCVENGAASNDQDLFFVMTENLYGNYYTKTGNIFNQATPCQYNVDLNNIASVVNWQGGIPNTFAQYLASTDSRFQASTTATYGNNGSDIFLGLADTEEPINYSDDYTSPNFDISNTYGNGTAQGNPVLAGNSRFTAIDDGFHSFSNITTINVSTLYNLTPPVTAELDIFVILKLYDSGNVLLNSYPHHETITAVGTYNYTHSDSFYMSTGDYVQVEWQVNMGTINTNAFFEFPVGAIFKCTASPDGGTYTDISTADYQVVNHVFEKELTPDEFEAIVADPRGLVNCDTHKNYSFSGWVEELSFTRAKGLAKWKLYSTKNLND